MIRPKTITLYAVENYAQPLEKGKMEVSYDDAVKLLSNDQDKVSYHIRLLNDKYFNILLYIATSTMTELQQKDWHQPLMKY
jgi:hypothetical protein